MCDQQPKGQISKTYTCTLVFWLMVLSIHDRLKRLEQARKEISHAPPVWIRGFCYWDKHTLARDRGYMPQGNLWVYLCDYTEDMKCDRHVTSLVELSCIIQWKIMGVVFFSWGETAQRDLQKCCFFIPVFHSASAEALSAAAGMFTSNSEKQCASFQMHLPARIYMKTHIFQLLPGQNSALAEHNFK